MKTAIFWFRRNLRLEDNHGLFKALTEYDEVIPLFIFDEDILSRLSDKKDRRVDFIHRCLVGLNSEIQQAGASGLLVKHGQVEDVWKQLLTEFKPQAVFCNHDYEPDTIKRDLNVERICEASGVSFRSYKDQVIFEENEIQKTDGTPYTVYTPYSKAWKAKFTEDLTEEYPSQSLLNKLTARKLPSILKLEDIGFQKSDLVIPSKELDESNIKDYEKNRDIPCLDATSRLSVHLRFGTVSIRKLVKKANKINSKFLNELIWREFFMMILYNFPNSVKHEFREKYSGIKWRYDEDDFKKWCFGKTGYPIVDAGMRELNETGFMHNRVRMITASFLVKHLLIDWRWGERYFAKKLLDYDLSANVGNWQWAAGTGCDAAPYFRIFNPYTQTDKFDKNREYIKKWVPEFGTPTYPQPMIDHKEARERALKVYKEGIG
ncbi:MAG: DNA photolyase family protein [Lentisphaeraceae bacterium]|nr:DNA photolyase family protein [Lentisphaeraceae bacterium]